MVSATGHQTWVKLQERATPLDRRRLEALSPILVIAPHQDDETLGCGGLLATASQLGLRPQVAFLTDGAASHTGSASWPAERLAKTRRREALAALSLLGVPRRDICFLGWTDAQPYRAGEAAYAATLKRLAHWITPVQPRSLWSPWPGEKHCDHVAAGELAADLALRLPSRPLCMDYLVWGWAEPDLAIAQARVWALTCSQTIDVRRRALACHRTQVSNLIADAEFSFQIPAPLAALTQRPVEVYLERR